MAADYAQTRAYAKRVRDLLQEYAALSPRQDRSWKRSIRSPTRRRKTRPRRDGLTAAPTDPGDVVYFGLSAPTASTARKPSPISRRTASRYLEYDLSSLIYRLATPKKPKVALITSLPIMGSPQNPQPLAAYAALAQEYDVTNLSSDFTAIPPDTDLLVIAHPPQLPPQMLLAIDNFVLSGKHALIFVDPLSELAQRGDPQSAAAPASDLGPLLKSWGVDYPNNMVLLDRSLAQQVAAGNDPREPSVAYPVWLHLTPADFDLHDPITASLSVAQPRLDR